MGLLYYTITILSTASHDNITTSSTLTPPAGFRGRRLGSRSSAAGTVRDRHEQKVHRLRYTSQSLNFNDRLTFNQIYVRSFNRGPGRGWRPRVSLTIWKPCLSAT